MFAVLLPWLLCVPLRWRWGRDVVGPDPALAEYASLECEHRRRCGQQPLEVEPAGFLVERWEESADRVDPACRWMTVLLMRFSASPAVHLRFQREGSPSSFE